MNLFGTGYGLDLDSQFAKQDWNRTQKNQSLITSNLWFANKSESVFETKINSKNEEFLFEKYSRSESVFETKVNFF